MIRKFWHYLKESTGENAYGDYLAHHAKAHPDHAPVSKKQFYNDRMKKKWDGINRCC